VKLESGGGDALDAAYRDLRRALALSGPAQPYNLLVTRTWMMLVPRTRAEYQGIPVNGLGFAGALVARTPAQLAMLRERGPLAVLQAVAP
jgi:ATP adenylyltransferase